MKKAKIDLMEFLPQKPNYEIETEQMRDKTCMNLNKSPQWWHGSHSKLMQPQHVVNVRTTNCLFERRISWFFFDVYKRTPMHCVSWMRLMDDFYRKRKRSALPLHQFMNWRNENQKRFHCAFIEDWSVVYIVPPAVEVMPPQSRCGRFVNCTNTNKAMAEVLECEIVLIRCDRDLFSLCFLFAHWMCRLYFDPNAL